VKGKWELFIEMCLNESVPENFTSECANYITNWMRRNGINERINYDKIAKETCCFSV